MYIVEKQQLWYDNIMSYRTRVEEKKTVQAFKPRRYCTRRIGAWTERWHNFHYWRKGWNWAYNNIRRWASYPGWQKIWKQQPLCIQVLFQAWKCRHEQVQRKVLCAERLCRWTLQLCWQQQIQADNRCVLSCAQYLRWWMCGRSLPRHKRKHTVILRPAKAVLFMGTAFCLP